MKKTQIPRLQGPVMICMLTTLNFRNLSPSEKALRSLRIVNCMQGNSHFPDPKPALSNVLISIRAVQNAEKHMDGSRTATIQRDARLAELESKMQQLRSYVDTEANGNAEVIASAGFDIRKTPISVGLLDFPTCFTVNNTPVAGQIKLKWKGVKKRKSYIVEYTSDPNGVEGIKTICITKTGYIINDLSDAVKLYFRIATLTAAGNGGFSPWVSCRPN